VWWRCVHGHVWRTSPHKRVSGTGCPYCARLYAVRETSLAVVRPDVAAEWHPTRNGDLTPADVLPGAGARVWWQCGCGYEWQALVVSRTKGTGCPRCADSRPRGVPLLQKRPDLATEWDAQRNGPLDDNVMAGSHRRVWWQCSDAHRWQATIQRRARDRTRCPYCAGRRPTPENCLATVLPLLAAEWHPERNGPLSAADVLPHSRKRVWWRCASGHEWEAVVGARARGHSCPFCAGTRVEPGRSLAALYPTVATELNLMAVDPWQLAPHSPKRVLWTCSHGHSWSARVSDRTNGHGCPYCSGRLATLETSLAARHPELAATWHPNLNERVTPDDVLPGSHRRAWWRCELGHAWQATIAARTRGARCPICLT
jgi:uncharacterized Zn-finger protein